MKKLFTTLLATTLALSSFGGLVACGDDDEYNGVKSEKVSSAAEWAAAFDFSEIDNATVKLLDIENTVHTYYFDGNKTKMAFPYMNDDGTYYDKIDYREYKTDEIYEGSDRGTEYYYQQNKETGKWSVTKQMIFDIDSVNDMVRDGFDDMTREYDEETERYAGNVSERFADFEYDNSLYAYVAKYDTLEDATNFVVTVKILNGKLAYGSITCDMEDEGETAHIKIECSVYDIGKTVVELPTGDELTFM